MNDSRRHRTQKICLVSRWREQKGVLWTLYLSGLDLQYSKVTLFPIVYAENVQPTRETFTFLLQVHSYRNSIGNKIWRKSYANLTLCRRMTLESNMTYGSLNCTILINVFHNMSNISLSHYALAYVLRLATKLWSSVTRSKPGHTYTWWAFYCVQMLIDFMFLDTSIWFYFI